MDHVDIYYQNAQHPSFQLMGSFPEAQYSTIANIALRLLYHLKDADAFNEDARKTEVEDFISDFNQSNNKWTMRFDSALPIEQSNIYLRPQGFGEYSDAINISTQKKLENYGD